MFRFALILGFALSPLAAAAQDKAVICKTSGEIVESAVAARNAGAAKDSATKSIADGLSPANEAYVAAVPPIVDWVYSLDKAKLDDGVAQSYVKACLAQ